MAEKKSITIVVGSGEKERYDLSNDTEFSALLRSLQAFNLRNETNGSFIFGFQSLENGHTYTVGKPKVDHADQPPVTPPDKIIRSAAEAAFQELPPSPPRNGIRRADVLLDRNELVNSIRKRANPIVIISSPPGTGKTSLLDLTEAALTANNSGDNNQVVRLSLIEDDDKNLLNLLERQLGVSHDKVNSLITSDCHLWILFDDAQLAFKAESFWKVVVKDFEAIGPSNIRVIIVGLIETKLGDQPPPS